MPYLRRLSERHQITIPPALLKAAGAPEDALFSINVEKRRIVLEPAEVVSPGLSEEDWDELDNFVKRQVQAKRYSEYANPKDAKKHLKRLLE